MLPETIQVTRVLHEERIAASTKPPPEGWTVQVPNIFDRIWNWIKPTKKMHMQRKPHSKQKSGLAVKRS